VSKFFASAVLLFLSGNGFAAAIIYEDTFEAGEPLDYSIVFGSPQVTGPAGLFSTGSLEFTAGPEGYDQIEFQMNRQEAGSFRIAFDLDMSRTDMYTEYNQTGLTVLFDLPGSSSFFFSANNQDLDGNPIYDYSQILAVEILVDLDNRTKTLVVNDELIFDFAISNPRYFDAIRFSHRSDGGGNPVLVDNIVISSVVPIPAAVWLFGSALLGLISNQRRSK